MRRPERVVLLAAENLVENGGRVGADVDGEAVDVLRTRSVVVAVALEHHPLAGTYSLT